MNNGVRKGLQAILILIIAVLGYFLYRSINDPYAEYQRREAIEQSVHNRMEQNMQMLIRFERTNRRFPSTLDSLVLFVKADSAAQAEGLEMFGEAFMPDSLMFSPRSGNVFLYTASDTGAVKYYKLTDPDNPANFIGTDTGDVNRINLTSW